MKKRRLIPFRLLPGSFGLCGEVYDKAEAHYLYDGKDLECALANIEHRNDEVTLTRALLAIDRKYGDLTPLDYALALLRLDGNETPLALAQARHQHGALDSEPYERLVAEQTLTDMARDLQLLALDYKYEHISKLEYEKQRATLREEPWIATIDHGFDPNGGLDGVYFEFDWNKFWIEYLQLNGYSGSSEEDIVERWFTEVCRSQVASSDGPALSMREAHDPQWTRALPYPPIGRS